MMMGQLESPSITGTKSWVDTDDNKHNSVLTEPLPLQPLQRTMTDFLHDL